VVFEQLLQRVADARTQAVQAAQSAQDERRRRREENDLWVTGGVNWNGFGLESLIRMVADKSSVGQLDALAGEWSRHGANVVRASDDLQRSLTTLAQFWGGTASDQAMSKVMTNAAWIGELGTTAQQMSGPIQDASGALRSAQDTMPGMPKNNWLATAGGGAAAGFAVGGPVGAAFGAAIGGIASAFGFGNSKKKMKRKAVQTMERFEGAIVGVDQTTPQFGAPSDGSNPGDPQGPRPTPPPIDRPSVPLPPPGGGVVKPIPHPVDGNGVTDPSFAGGPEGRWQSLTGLGPGGSPGLPGVGTGGGAGGGGGLGGLGLGGFPGGSGLAGGGRGPGAMGGSPVGGGRGGARGAGGVGGRGGAGGGVGGRGAGGRGAGGRGAGGRGGVPGGGMGGRGDREFRGRGRFSRTGGFGQGQGQGAGGAAGRREDGEEDGEHRRTVPIEEDLFSSDLKAAPPVIGL
jgi:hypothetical protein